MSFSGWFAYSRVRDERENGYPLPLETRPVAKLARSVDMAGQSFPTPDMPACRALSGRRTNNPRMAKAHLEPMGQPGLLSGFLIKDRWAMLSGEASTT